MLILMNALCILIFDLTAGNGVKGPVLLFLSFGADANIKEQENLIFDKSADIIHIQYQLNIVNKCL